MILWFKHKVEKKKPKGIFLNTASENHYMVMKYIQYSQMWKALAQKHLFSAAPFPSTENWKAPSHTVVHKQEQE